ncbi:Abi family protein [Zhihengliuella halotolerans]|uniref:Abi family protein n=1 Tax=Zhihengliuella halotolerans TaxID=370736 RepID=UPI000C809355|nr:Abi family protein [Zhihengliuella halotolerans]
MGDYDKPFLTFDEQINLLRKRGLDNLDRATALRDLQRIGYYRLSAYTYPLRSTGASTGETTADQRSTQFATLATFEDAVGLHDFDQRLRAVTLDALAHLELALRTAVAHGLGKHSPFGHETGDGLGPHIFQTMPRKPGSTRFDDWRRRYDKLRAAASTEDFVRHFEANYNARFPIWVAVEFFDFGATAWLFSLLTESDQRTISRQFGILQPRVFQPWLRSLNSLRNDCAHHNRVWNRVWSTVPPRPSAAVLRDRRSLPILEKGQRDRYAFRAGLLQVMLQATDSSFDWRASLARTLASAPNIDGIDIGQSMGFAATWRDSILEG